MVGSPVTSWTDRKGGVAFTSSGTIPLATVNGRSVPDFTNGPYLQTSSLVLTQDTAHVFVVAQVDSFGSSVTDGILFRVNRASSTSWAGCGVYFVTFNRSLFFERQGGAGGNVYRSNTDALAVGQTYLLEFLNDGTTGERGFWVNGKKQNGQTVQEVDPVGLWWSRPSTATHTQIGTASFDSDETGMAFDGRICETWVYQGVRLSAHDMWKNRLYARTRWNVPLN